MMDPSERIDMVRSRLRPWVSQYGETRYYVNDWYDLVKDVIEPYAENEWTSPDIKKIRKCRVWFDQSGQLHVDGIKDVSAIDVIVANVERAVLGVQ